MASEQKYGIPQGALAAQGGFGAMAPVAAAPPQGYVTPYQPAIQPGGIPPVIGQQPGGLQIQWMPAPQAAAVGCPPGLEHLIYIDRLLVHQQIKPSETFAEARCPNRYQIKNSINQLVYLAHEDSDVFVGECTCCRGGGERGFQIHITDSHNQEVLRLSRESCKAANITVLAPVGNVIGYVRQEPKCWCCLFPNFTVRDSANKPVLRIQGPVVPFNKQNKIDFMIMDESLTTELGQLTKQPQGIPHTNVGDFSIKFPSDLSIDMKACLLGSLFSIEFIYFEDRKIRYQT